MRFVLLIKGAPKNVFHNKEATMQTKKNKTKQQSDSKEKKMKKKKNLI